MSRRIISVWTPRSVIFVGCIVFCLCLSAGLVSLGIQGRESIEPRIRENSATLASVIEQNLIQINLNIDSALLTTEKDLAKKNSAKLPPEILFSFALDARGKFLKPVEPLHLRAITNIEKILKEKKSVGNQVRILDPVFLDEVHYVIPFIKATAVTSKKVQQYVGVALKGEVLDETFSKFERWGDSAIVVASKEGQILIRHPSRPEALGGDFRNKSPVWKLAKTQPIGFFFEKSPIDDVEKLIHYRLIENTPLLLMVNRDKKEMYSSWEFDNQVRISILILGIFVISILGWMLWRYVCRLEIDRAILRKYRSYTIENDHLEDLGRFIGSIAHDLNNILTILFGHLDRLERVLPPALRKERAALLSSAKRSRDLLKQTLTLGRPHQENIEIFDLRNWLKEALPLLRTGLGAKVDISTMPSPQPIQMQGDRGLLIHALIQIFSSIADQCDLETLNAVFAPQMAEGDHADLILRIPASGELKLKPDVRELHLFISELMLQKMGGRIKIKNPASRTCSVEVIWSQLLPPQKHTQKDAEIADLPSAPRVIFVDDEVSMLEIAQDSLAQKGILIDAWNDPQAAWETIQENFADIDVLVTDINMPTMSGFELADRVQKIDSRIGVVFVTAHPDCFREAQGRVSEFSGPADVLIKPYQLDDLARLIRILASRRMSRPRLDGQSQKSE